MNKLVDTDDKVLYLCDIYKNMTEGKCEGTMCMIGGVFNGDCKHTRKREFSRNYKDHEPTEEDIINCFYRMGNYLIEVEQ